MDGLQHTTMLAAVLLSHQNDIQSEDEREILFSIWVDGMFVGDRNSERQHPTKDTPVSTLGSIVQKSGDVIQFGGAWKFGKCGRMTLLEST